MNRSIFEMEPPAPLSKDILGADPAGLAGFALDAEEELLSSLKDVIERSPFRNMVTPGGFRMSVAMSNCGSLEWVTERTGANQEQLIWSFDNLSDDEGRKYAPSLQGLPRHSVAAWG